MEITSFHSKNYEKKIFLFFKICLVYLFGARSLVIKIMKVLTAFYMRGIGR